MARIEDGNLAWTRTYGVKVASKNKPVTDSTLFEAASMSKAPFAYAPLRLVDRKKFDLDIPLVEISGTPYEKFVRDTPEDTLHKKSLHEWYSSIKPVSRTGAGTIPFFPHLYPVLMSDIREKDLNFTRKWLNILRV